MDTTLGKPAAGVVLTFSRLVSNFYYEDEQYEDGGGGEDGGGDEDEDGSHLQ